MDLERWRRVEELYNAAQAQPADKRAAFLRAACGSDEGLQQDVESLLAQQEASWAPPAGLTAEAFEQGAARVVGRRIGVYLVQAVLGAGGMGEVYRARDTKLGRDVAIKVLPRIFTSDPERRTRFEREARMLASLNHPHIGAIYGFEDADGICALVLELVEGQTLADRIAQGPVPQGEALQIAKVLDFGLAKAAVGDSAAPDLSKLPTITVTARPWMSG